MPPDVIRRLLLNKPFQPFRLHVLEATAYEVWQPSAAFVGKAIVTLHQSAAGALSELWMSRIVVALLHVSKVEMIGPPPASGNGQAGQGAPA
jgi:hypothetical protein